MAKHYDFLTENKDGQVVVARYNTDREAYDCPGGFKFYSNPNDEDDVSTANYGQTGWYVED
jgi:hypothetical protein